MACRTATHRHPVGGVPYWVCSGHSRRRGCGRLVADAEAQTVIVCRAEFCLNVFLLLRPPLPPPSLNLIRPQGMSSFVVDDEDFFGFDFIKLRKGGNCLSGTVHERGRLENVAVGQGGTGDSLKNFFLL